MPIHKLDHVNIRTHQLVTLIGWYQRVLGLRVGARPNFPFPGAWLFAGDTVVVHLIGVESPSGAGSESELKLEHFAFSATDLDAFENTLRELGEPHQRAELASFGLVQINLWDPDGNHLHVDFPSGP
ncbi:glyoxalase [Hydrogenophaga crassostreae]|uniref:Glyoxalase n=1 Tax=Hydrogenophaga crassostreae TaxID=1763535 RepID=A0A162SY75_9BURK|nr:VOC family protein [Hydrogenophaga crassostreae]AOW13942.1 glyoxalase [Hydrogenophaga crassostreae]OAD44093.1 glyoxalase [Hydrogenophaga crassostreae]